MQGKLLEELEFKYENFNSKSFLVVKTGDKVQISDYQVKMLEYNNIERLLPFNVKRKNSDVYFYYDITSKLNVSFFLKRRRLKRDEFIKLLADILRVMAGCGGYLLTDACFIIDTEYMFINPETLEPSLAYVPVAGCSDARESFRDFVTRLILHDAEIDESGCDNFLQRILAFIKKDAFNTGEFLDFLNDLLYGFEKPALSEEKTFCNLPGEAGNVTQVAAAVREIKRGASGKLYSSIPGIKPNSGITAGFVLLQILLAAAVPVCGRFAIATAGSPAAAYSAAAIIVLALDALLFKNVFYKKLFKKTDMPPVNATADPDIALSCYNRFNPEAAQPVMEYAGQPQIPPVKGEFHRAAGNMPHETGGRDGSPAHGSCNTVLLGSGRAGLPVLRSLDPAEPAEMVIDRPDYILGRLAGQVDYTCRNNAVGKVHAQILGRDGSYFIRDLNSVNGTFINNIRIDSNKDCGIKENDHIRLANSEFLFTFK